MSQHTTLREYRPDQHLRFVSLHDMEERVLSMRQRFDVMRQQGASPRTALYRSYVDEFHREGLLVSGGDSGVTGFHRDMVLAIKAARRMVHRVVERWLSDIQQQLYMHSSVFNTLNPVRLLMMATDVPKQEASKIDQRRVREALRSFALALQLLVIERNDPEIGISDDMSDINDLMAQRLFAGDLQVYVVALRDKKKAGRVKGQPYYFEDAGRAMSCYEKLARRNGRRQVYISPLSWHCRLVQMGDRVFVVNLIDNAKEVEDMLVKLERYHAQRADGQRDDMRVYDGRRWKLVLLGQRMGGGRIQPADRAMLEEFVEVTRQQLWRDPLQVGDRQLSGNPHRDNNYHDFEVVGRYLRMEQYRIVAGPCEQLAQTGKDALSTQLSRSDDNHYCYRGRQLLTYVFPLWWPHVEQVDWQDGSFQEFLKRAWRSSLR